MKTTKFKLSEIGPIPEEWEVKRLGDICSNFNYGVGAEAVPYVSGSKYIRITDIDESSRRFSPPTLTAPSFETENSRVNEGDILVARTGASVGKTYVYDPQDGNLTFAGFLMRLHPEAVNHRYVFLTTLTGRYEQWIASESARSGQPGINIQQLKTFQIPVPPKPEQEKIAAVLSDVDELLAAMTELIEKKRAIKQGAMQELLEVREEHGDGFKTGLTGFTGLRNDSRVEVEKCRKNSESGSGAEPQHYTSTPLHGQDKNPVNPVNPVEKTYAPRRRLAGFTGAWVEKRLGDVLSIGNGKDYKHLPSGDIPVYGTGGLMTYVNASLHDGPTVCIGRKGTIDEPQYHEGKIWTVDTLFYTYDFEGVNPKFLYYLFTRIDWQSYNTATGVPSLTAKAICDIEVYFPTLAEQKAIAGVLADMDAEIAALEAKRAKYEQIKRGMMQELLTGRLRLG